MRNSYAQRRLTLVIIWAVARKCWLGEGTHAFENKKIVFLRHGCTYMNEYLGRGISFGAPGFTDVFDSHAERLYYRDSPLSPLGQRQAQALAASNPSFLENCELIVTSPLTRALQTLDLGVVQPLQKLGRLEEVPIMALPHAAERLYLISDVGRPVHEISQEFNYVDFETGFARECDQDVNAFRSMWWYQKTKQYEAEWRPTGQGQRYACPGEPEDAFSDRMQRLYKWLKDRPENKIAVVCHWGVINWMLGVDFDNCQWQEVALNELQPQALTRQKQG